MVDGMVEGRMKGKIFVVWVVVVVVAVATIAVVVAVAVVVVVMVAVVVVVAVVVFVGTRDEPAEKERARDSVSSLMYEL